MISLLLLVPSTVASSVSDKMCALLNACEVVIYFMHIKNRIWFKKCPMHASTHEMLHRINVGKKLVFQKR